MLLMVRQGWGAEARLFPVLVAVAAIALHGSWVVDDAGIVWAYARNLASGNGLVAFEGGPRGEGFSDPLWLVLLAAGEGVGIRADIAAKTLGLVSGVLAVMLAPGLSRSAEEVDRVMVAMGLATSASWALWAASGLETGLCGALMVATALAARRGLFNTAAALAALVTWTRPEGALLAAAALVSGRAPRRVFLAPVLALGTLLAVRQSVFGEWLPLPALVKLSADPASLVRGLVYLAASLAPVGALLALGAWAMPSDRRRAAVLDLAPLWAVIAFSVLSGGDWMRHGRFVAPALPFLFATCLPPLRAWLTQVRPEGAPGLGAALVAVALVPQAAESLGTREAPPLPMQVQARQGDVLARVARSSCGAERPRVATADVGGVLWSLPQVQVADLGGLTEPDLVGRKPGAYWPRRLSEEPVHAVYLHGGWPARTGLTDRAMRHAGYQRVCRRGESVSAPTLWVHRRCNLGLVGDDLAWVGAWCAHGARQPLVPQRAPDAPSD